MLKLAGRAFSSSPAQCHCKAATHGSWRTDMFVDWPNRFVADQTERHAVDDEYKQRNLAWLLVVHPKYETKAQTCIWEGI